MHYLTWIPWVTAFGLLIVNYAPPIPLWAVFGVVLGFGASTHILWEIAEFYTFIKDGRRRPPRTGIRSATSPEPLRVGDGRADRQPSRSFALTLCCLNVALTVTVPRLRSLKATLALPDLPIVTVLLDGLAALEGGDERRLAGLAGGQRGGDAVAAWRA